MAKTFLENDRRFIAPKRRQAMFKSIAAAVPNGAPWEKSDMLRIYFSDKSFIFIDETGRPRSTGGIASKEFISKALYSV